MTRKFTYLVWIALALLACTCYSCKPAKRKVPVMYPPFMYGDKGPAGTSLAYRLLLSQFGSNTEVQRLSKSTLYKYNNSYNYLRRTVYINVGKPLVGDSEEVATMLHYVANGNDVFLSMAYFPTLLLDTLHIHIHAETDTSAQPWLMRKTSVRVSAFPSSYSFFFEPFLEYFENLDSNSTVLGVGDQGKPNFITKRYGRGRIFFHLAPYAFSNYFLLKDDNTAYYQQALSYLPVTPTFVYWADTRSFMERDNDFSMLGIFWKNPPLKWALLMVCGLVLLYLAFGSKRKRNLVPVIPPNTNASLSFVRTIGNLYLQKKDNRNIALKKITFFLEHVRTRYHLATGNLNTDFVQSLSRRSGVEEESVKMLVGKIDFLNNIDQISDHELFEINNLVDEFYKR